MNADLSAIREKGLKVLKKELGPAGMVYFVKQFSSGSGNYTEERRSLQKAASIEDIADRIKRRKLAKTPVKSRKTGTNPQNIYSPTQTLAHPCEASLRLLKISWQYLDTCPKNSIFTHNGA